MHDPQHRRVARTDFPPPRLHRDSRLCLRFLSGFTRCNATSRFNRLLRPSF
jgi:hypothetical protein